MSPTSYQTAPPRIPIVSYARAAVKFPRAPRPRENRSTSMHIASIETFIAGNPWKNWLFAKVTTSDGVYGVGEGTLNYFAKTVEAAIQELKPLVLGMDPFQV